MDYNGYNYGHTHKYDSHRSISASEKLLSHEQDALVVPASPPITSSYAKPISPKQHTSPTSTYLTPIPHYDSESKSKYSSHLLPPLSPSSTSSSHIPPGSRNESAYHAPRFTSPKTHSAAPRHTQARSASHCQPDQYQYLQQNLYILPPRHSARLKSPTFYILFFTTLIVLTTLCINTARLVRLLKAAETIPHSDPTSAPNASPPKSVINTLGLFTTISLGYVLVLTFLTAIFLILLTSFFKSTYPPPIQRSAASNRRGYSYLTRSQKSAFVQLVILYILWMVVVPIQIVDERLRRDKDDASNGSNSGIDRIEVRVVMAAVVILGIGMLIVGWGIAGGICCNGGRRGEKGRTGGGYGRYGYERARQREEWEMGDGR